MNIDNFSSIPENNFSWEVYEKIENLAFSSSFDPSWTLWLVGYVLENKLHTMKQTLSVYIRRYCIWQVLVRTESWNKNR